MATDLDLGPDSREPKLFSALLKPHRALSHNGLLILIGLVGTAGFAAGLAFWTMGAWPVFGFFGLDVLALAVAFRVSFARARASEEISMTSSELRVRRTSARGEVAEWVLNPLWVRLERIVHHEAGIERLYLVSSGRRLRSPASSARRKKRVSPMHCWPRWTPRGAVRCTNRDKQEIGWRRAPPRVTSAV